LTLVAARAGPAEAHASSDAVKTARNRRRNDSLKGGIRVYRQLTGRGPYLKVLFASPARELDPRGLAHASCPDSSCPASADRARSIHCQDADHVFATKSGRPVSQRNVLQALTRAQTTARTSEGKPTFPALFEAQQDADGRWVPCKGKVPAGSVPSFHGFRHSYASYAIAAGDSAEEVSWTLGHKHSGITRQVYIQEVKSAERRAQMRSKLEARHGSMLAALTGSALEATDASSGQQTATPEAEILALPQRPAESSS
jgi:integrase